MLYASWTPCLIVAATNRIRYAKEMASIIVLLCLAAPPLLMWWMLVVQRRVRDQLREKSNKEEKMAPAAAYVDELRQDNGLSYGKAMESGMPPAPEIAEIEGVKALQGLR